MTVYASKPEINVREKLKELDYGHIPYHKMPAGSVIQFAEYTTSANSIYSNSFSTYVSAGIAAKFSPKFANSLIKVEIRSRRFNLVAGLIMNVGVARDGLNGATGEFIRYGSLNNNSAGEIYYENRNSSGSNQIAYGLYYPFLDKPNTTSELTYEVWYKNNSNNGNAVYLADSGGVQMFITEIKQ
mgnify:CR=1 FL=1